MILVNSSIRILNDRNDSKFMIRFFLNICASIFLGLSQNLIKYIFEDSSYVGSFHFGFH